MRLPRVDLSESTPLILCILALVLVGYLYVCLLGAL